MIHWYFQVVLLKIKKQYEKCQTFFQNWGVKVKSRFSVYHIFFVRIFFRIKEQFSSYTNLKKRMLVMLALLLLLFGSIFIFHLFKAYQMQKYSKMEEMSIVVSAQPVTYTAWQPKIRAFGSVRAIQGVEVTSEVAGLVRKIYFKSGAAVEVGKPLVELNANADKAHLDSLKALAELAEITYLRDKEQYALKAVSKATVDASFADFRSKEAAVVEQSDIVAKKTICAPFSGLLGISVINEGQYLNPGDKIVTLQCLNPVYVDFYIPQQEFVKVVIGATAIVKVDCYPEKIFKGIVTAIDPEIASETRNAYIQATLSNIQHELLPGMFVSIEVYAGTVKQYLTLPQSAISYNPYGEIVYVILETGKDKNGAPILLVRETFVTVGETRGDQVAILKGLKEGDKVVTSGQHKLKNGTKILINNSVLLPNDPDSSPVDE